MGDAQTCVRRGGEVGRQIKATRGNPERPAAGGGTAGRSAHGGLVDQHLLALELQCSGIAFDGDTSKAPRKRQGIQTGVRGDSRAGEKPTFSRCEVERSARAGDIEHGTFLREDVPGDIDSSSRQNLAPQAAEFAGHGKESSRGGEPRIGTDVHRGAGKPGVGFHRGKRIAADDADRAGGGGHRAEKRNSLPGKEYFGPRLDGNQTARAEHNIAPDLDLAGCLGLTGDGVYAVEILADSRRVEGERNRIPQHGRVMDDAVESQTAVAITAAERKDMTFRHGTDHCAGGDRNGGQKIVGSGGRTGLGAELVQFRDTLGQSTKAR